jgi:RHS repeat-associated protein
MIKNAGILMAALVTLAVGGLNVSAEEPKLKLDDKWGVPPQDQSYFDALKKAQAAQKAQRQAAEGEDANFFTGKPFDAELGYVFKYRNYNPETQRWTTMDPSGFPDGANNYCYISEPHSWLDPNGFAKISSTAALAHYYGGSQTTLTEQFDDYYKDLNWEKETEAENFTNFLSQLKASDSGTIDVISNQSWNVIQWGVGRINFELIGSFYTDSNGDKIFDGVMTIQDNQYHLEDRPWGDRSLFNETATRATRWAVNGINRAARAIAGTNTTPANFWFTFNGSTNVHYILPE